jgi:hypothetical protein
VNGDRAAADELDLAARDALVEAATVLALKGEALDATSLHAALAARREAHADGCTTDPVEVRLRAVLDRALGLVDAFLREAAAAPVPRRRGGRAGRRRDDPA